MRVSASRSISPAGRARPEQCFTGIQSCKISATKDKSASRSGLAARAPCADAGRLLAVTLHHCRKVVLDIAETGMAAEFRGGAAAPNARNFESVRQCERVLPKGIKVRRARIDAAGYQARIISHFTNHGIGYAIRAKLGASVAGQTGALDESQ